MSNGPNPKLCLGMTLQQARQSSFGPGIANGQPLPVVHYGVVCKEAPILLPTPMGNLPKASAVVITGLTRKWATLQHVFLRGHCHHAIQQPIARHLDGLERYSVELQLYADDVDDDAVRTLLNELASEIGSILEQEEVHVAYRDRTWTLKASG